MVSFTNHKNDLKVHRVIYLTLKNLKNKEINSDFKNYICLFYFKWSESPHAVGNIACLAKRH